MEAQRDRLALARSSSDRWVAGVAGGLAHRLGVQAIYVRVAFVSFLLVGFAVYVGLLVLTIDSSVDTTEEGREATGQEKLALLMLTMGGLLLVRELDLIPNSVIPAALVLFGIAALWDRSTPAGRSKLTRLVAPNVGGAPTLGRAIGGGLLLIIGVSLLFSGTSVVREAGKLVTGVLIAGIGAAVVFGPWLYRLAKELSAERSERIRADTRAEVAAHLHDSVLQTLALIQRSADDPRKMVTLARSQERELRNWLYRSDTSDHSELEAAVQEAASKVERDHDVPIEVIVVGTAPVDDHVEALVGATREAMVNAAKHSGADIVSVYVEADADSIEAWITDQGRGFTPDSPTGDGVGISGSIVGRMERHGGRARIASSAEDGTEVHLSMPRSEGTE
jgi:signal transduction histidine kinase